MRQTLPDEKAFRSPERMFNQNWPALAQWLKVGGHDFDLEFTPRQFRGGVGNFNFLIRIDGRYAVLRRPPPGPRPPGANDMVREHRVLTMLHPHNPLVPTPIALCEDEEIIGAPFLISEFRSGHVIRGDKLDAPPQTRRAVAQMLIRELAKLHATPLSVDQASALGKPGGFARRTVSGWRKRAMVATDEAPSALLVEVADWLEANVPSDSGAPTLLHNDFKFDNMIVDPEDPTRPRAILDWDMATLGEPLFDLATTFSYWTSPSDPMPMMMLRQMPSALDGFLSRQEAAELYGELTGADMSPLVFYRALGQFKLAIVIHQLHARWRRAPEKFPEFEHSAVVAEGLIAFTRDIIDERIF